MSGDEPRSLWGGLGSLVKSAVTTTLNAVDALQDRITAFDAQTSKPSPPPEKAFDESLLPILENPMTYLDEPMSPLYQSYLSSFDLDAHEEETTLFCDRSPTLRRLRSRLVPSALPARVFWSRLFFKLEQRDAAKKKSQQLLELVDEDSRKATTDALAGGSVQLTDAELEELERLADELPDEWE
jgi:hypothetical protein